MSNFSIPDNIEYINSNLSLENNLKNSFDSIDALWYEARKDGSFLESGSGYYPNTDSSATTFDHLRNVMMADLSMQIDIVNNLKKSGEQLEKSYNKSADMYRNQKYINDMVKSEYNTLQKRNFDVLQGMDNKKRQIEINNYYYKKNNAQVRILYNIVYLCVFIYVLYFFNRNTPNLVPDILFSVSVGLGLGIFVLYLFYALYDIYLRDNTNFDEYTMHWNSKMTTPKPMEVEKELDMSLCDPNANSQGEGLNMT